MYKQHTLPVRRAGHAAELPSEGRNGASFTDSVVVTRVCGAWVVFRSAQTWSMASGFSDTSKMTAVAPRCTALFACEHRTTQSLETFINSAGKKPGTVWHSQTPELKFFTFKFRPQEGVLRLNVAPCRSSGANKRRDRKPTGQK